MEALEVISSQLFTAYIVQTKEELRQQKQAADDVTAAFVKMQGVIEGARRDYEEAQDDAKKYSISSSVIHN